MEENPYQSPLTHSTASDRGHRSIFQSIPIPKPIRIVFWLGLLLLGGWTAFYGVACFAVTFATLFGFMEIKPNEWGFVPLALGMGVVLTWLGGFLLFRSLKRLRNYVNFDRRATDDESR